MTASVARSRRSVFEPIPYAVVALLARAATVTVFLRAGLAKLGNWETTVFLFAEEYRVPLVAPEWAASLALAMELGGSALVALGLLTRVTVLGLIAMTAVIQLFVYPVAWPDHLQWLAFMLILLARGAGACSLDHWIGRWRARPESRRTDEKKPPLVPRGRVVWPRGLLHQRADPDSARAAGAGAHRPEFSRVAGGTAAVPAERQAGAGGLLGDLVSELSCAARPRSLPIRASSPCLPSGTSLPASTMNLPLLPLSWRATKCRGFRACCC